MSFSKVAVLAGAVAFASTVAAHGYVTGIIADGVYFTGYNPDSDPYMQVKPVVVGWTTVDGDNGFIAPDNYTNPNIICHKQATPGQASAPVKAGGTVELQWTAWPSSHHGPVIDYLANCNGDCSTVDKTKLEFFKIDASGLDDPTPVPGTWASDKLIANNNSWTAEIPTDIAPGNYVLRHEIIALHSAGNLDGAQNYPQCVNLQISGSGTAAPEGTLGTALYHETDPGIEIDIYQTLSTYIIPGPTVYSGGAGAAPTSVVSSSVASVSSSSTSIVTPSSSSISISTSIVASTSSTVAPISSSISLSSSIVSSSLIGAHTTSFAPTTITSVVTVSPVTKGVSSSVDPPKVSSFPASFTKSWASYPHHSHSAWPKPSFPSSFSHHHHSWSSYGSKPASSIPSSFTTAISSSYGSKPASLSTTLSVSVNGSSIASSFPASSFPTSTPPITSTLPTSVPISLPAIITTVTSTIITTDIVGSTITLTTTAAVFKLPPFPTFPFSFPTLPFDPFGPFPTELAKTGSLPIDTSSSDLSRLSADPASDPSSDPSLSNTTTSDPPSGTTLNNVLSWLSSFFVEHGKEDYTENTVLRRHARDVDVADLRIPKRAIVK